MYGKRFAVGGVIVAVVGLGVNSAQASFPGRNGWIAVTVSCCSGSDSTDYSVSLFAPDGSRMKAGPPGGQVDVAFSPEGRRVASASGFDYGLFVEPMNGGGRERHITRGNDYGPAWGPGGKRIVFTRYDYGNGTESRADLRIYRHGSGRLLIRDASYPSWSVRNWIAFNRSNATTFDPSGGIWAIRPDGSGLHRILDYGGGVDWSPDGRRLVFTDDYGFIKTVRADGTGLRTLERGYAPAYSPDGHKIVYLGISARLINIMGSAGTRPHRVPHPQNHIFDGEETFQDPTWQPLPPRPGR